MGTKRKRLSQSGADKALEQDTAGEVEDDEEPDFLPSMPTTSLCERVKLNLLDDKMEASHTTNDGLSRMWASKLEFISFGLSQMRGA